MLNGKRTNEQAAPGGLSSVHGESSSPTATPTSRRSLLLGLGAAPLVLAAGRQDDEASALRAWNVVCVRHAEKGDDDARDPGLSEEGTARAEALAKLLGTAGVTHIFSTDYRRTQTTAKPLAELTELEVESYDPRAPEKLVKTLMDLPAGSVAVVVGHSNTTPQMVQALGAAEPAGLVDTKYGRILPEDCFDRVYIAQVVAVSKDADAQLVSNFELRYGD